MICFYVCAGDLNPGFLKCSCPRHFLSPLSLFCFKSRSSCTALAHLAGLDQEHCMLPTSASITSVGHHSWLFVLFSLFCFETVSHLLAQAGFELMILLCHLGL